MTNFFINALTSTPGEPITAYFKNGTSADYTTNVLELLKSDKSIEYIISSVTGEIIYQKG